MGTLPYFIPFKFSGQTKKLQLPPPPPKKKTKKSADYWSNAITYVVVQDRLSQIDPTKVFNA